MTVAIKGIRRPDGSTVEVMLDEAAAGGGASGMKKVMFDFAFDTPGLKDGVPVYNPAIGEVLYDAYFIKKTPFDGTTPSGDLSVGPALVGLFGMCYGVPKLNAGTPSNGVNNDNRTGQGSLLNLASGNGTVPGEFISTNPLELYVTQDGKCDGSGIAIDSTVGEVTLVLLII